MRSRRFFLGLIFTSDGYVLLHRDHCEPKPVWGGVQSIQDIKSPDVPDCLTLQYKCTMPLLFNGGGGPASMETPLNPYWEAAGKIVGGNSEVCLYTWLIHESHKNLKAVTTEPDEVFFFHCRTLPLTMYPALEYLIPMLREETIKTVLLVRDIRVEEGWEGFLGMGNHMLSGFVPNSIQQPNSFFVLESKREAGWVPFPGSMSKIVDTVLNVKQQVDCVPCKPEQPTRIALYSIAGVLLPMKTDKNKPVVASDTNLT